MSHRKLWERNNGRESSGKADISAAMNPSCQLHGIARRMKRSIISIPFSSTYFPLPPTHVYPIY